MSKDKTPEEGDVLTAYMCKAGNRRGQLCWTECNKKKTPKPCFNCRDEAEVKLGILKINNRIKREKKHTCSDCNNFRMPKKNKQGQCVMYARDVSDRSPAVHCNGFVEKDYKEKIRFCNSCEYFSQGKDQNEIGWCSKKNKITMETTEGEKCKFYRQFKSKANAKGYSAWIDSKDMVNTHS